MCNFAENNIGPVADNSLGQQNNGPVAENGAVVDDSIQVDDNGPGQYQHYAHLVSLLFYL